MPAPPLHVTFAEILAQADGAPKSVRSAVEHRKPYARLGSIYHDLPYYIGVVDLCVGYWREEAANITPWGLRLHRERPSALAEHLVRTMRTANGPLDREDRLAFLGGFLSHAVLDHTMHPLVNRLASQYATDLGGEVTHHHRTVEKFHSLFFHIERFGDDILGSSVMRQRMRVTGAQGVARSVAEFMTEAMRGHFGDAPSPNEWARWVRCYQRISWLLSTFPAARNSRRVRTEEMRRRYYSNGSYDFRDFFAAAERRTHRLLQFTLDYYDAAEFTDKNRERFIQEAALDDLAFPDTLRHPEPRIVEFCRNGRSAAQDGRTPVRSSQET